MQDGIVSFVFVPKETGHYHDPVTLKTPSFPLMSRTSSLVYLRDFDCPDSGELLNEALDHVRMLAQKICRNDSGWSVCSVHCVDYLCFSSTSSASSTTPAK